MRKGDIRKSEILGEAERLFFTKGYSATSINDILSSQHCSKGSFYHHFDSKLSVLTALCAAHAEAGFQRYQARAEGLEPAGRLDLLFSCSTPVSRDEEALCALLLPLLDTPEGEEVILSLARAQKARFLPELDALLSAMREKKQAFYPNPALPALVWDTHACLTQRLLSLGAGQMRDEKDALAPVLHTLEAARYMLERCLSLPYGSITIIRAPDCTKVLLDAARTAADISRAKGA